MRKFVHLSRLARRIADRRKYRAALVRYGLTNFSDFVLTSKIVSEWK